MNNLIFALHECYIVRLLPRNSTRKLITAESLGSLHLIIPKMNGCPQPVLSEVEGFRFSDMGMQDGCKPFVVDAHKHKRPTRQSARQGVELVQQLLPPHHDHREASRQHRRRGCGISAVAAGFGPYSAVTM